MPIYDEDFTSHPAQDEPISRGDNAIRETREAMKATLQINHVVKDDTSEGYYSPALATDYGKHKILQWIAMKYATVSSVFNAMFYADVGTLENGPKDVRIKKGGSFVFGVGIPVGTILDYAGATAPDGFLLCTGTSYSRATYADLFNAIGTTYGSVDSEHFNVPNLSGRTVLGAGTSPADARGQTIVLANAATGGEYSSVLTATNLPPHTHDVPMNRRAQYDIGSENAWGLDQYLGPIQTSGSPGCNSTAFSNMQPYMALNKIIKY